MIRYILVLVVLFAVALVALTMGANNDQMVNFSYIIAQSQMKLSTLITVLFGLGLLVGWSISVMLYLRLKLKNIGLERQVKRNMQQIHDLKMKK